MTAQGKPKMFARLGVALLVGVSVVAGWSVLDLALYAATGITIHHNYGDVVGAAMTGWLLAK